MNSLKSAVSYLLILAICLALLLPLSMLTPPRDSEVWLFQIISEMQDHSRFTPVLNAESLPGQNLLTLQVLSVLPVIDISTPRFISALLGCILVSGIFFFTRALFGLSSAVGACMVAMTSLGFISLFGTINLAALPVMLIVSAFGLFSWTYLKGLHGSLYIASYIFAGLGVITGGWFMLFFFLFGVLLLIGLDLEPSRFLSINLVPGILIIAGAMAAYTIAYRIITGQGFSAGHFSPGGHFGLFRGLWAVIVHSSPWFFLIVPAWLNGPGPSEKDAWRTLLPIRIALVLVLLMLWASDSSVKQYSSLFAVFSAPLIGSWISHCVFTGDQKGALGFWMMAISGITVILSAIVLILLPAYMGFGMHMKQSIAASLFIGIAILFFTLSVLRRTAGQFFTAFVSVFAAIWYLAFFSPADQWDRKIGFMEGISRNAPLMVYEDDLVMRGYMSAVNATPLIVNRNAVPLSGRAFLAASTSDADDLIEDLKKGMQPVLVDSYRAENTYALVMVSPRKRSW